MNSVIISGNLTSDPEVKTLPKGNVVTSFTIANNKKWRTESGETKERVTFVSRLCWGPRGEAFAKYHKKGSKALVSGELIQETWEDKTTGKMQSKTRVRVQEWEFVGSKQEDAPRHAAPRSRIDPVPGDLAQPATATAEDDVPF